MNNKQKVLIVDDEARNRRIINETLEGLFELQMASSGEEALEMVQKDPPDLVLLDIMMPGMSGYEVCQKIHEDPKLIYTKVILVSGKAMVEERLKGYASGADDYMTKPFETEELLAKVKVFLRLNQIEKELAEMNKSLDALVQQKVRQLIDAEVKLLNSAKMSALGEMAGGMAHEINTPLATILLLAEQQQEFILAGEIKKEDIESAFRIITLASNHIAKIVQGLRFFSRESSDEPLVKCELSKIIDDTIILCAERLKSHGIVLSVDSPQLEISCRPVQIAQVLLNLLNNSMHALENIEEKWIKVSIVRVHDSVEISVTDSGAGISEQAKDKIFQPFFTTKEVGKGTGLGLSISKGIIENHGGILYLDESSPNTCFKIKIPQNPVSVKSAS